MARTVIPEGYDFLPDRSRDNARKALALAEERGLEADVVLTVTDGYLIPLNEGGETADAATIQDQVEDDENSGGEAQAEEVVLPKESDSHADIDAFAASFDPPLTYDGIEAENAERPTKAEKIAHLTKAVEARAAENDAAAQTKED